MKQAIPFTIIAIVFLFAACGQRADHADHDSEMDASSHDDGSSGNHGAIANLSPTSGNQAAGTVTFAGVPDGGVMVSAHVTGLAPGKHGFHIHENGDCSAPDGSSAGGHYNPTGAPHGAPSSPAGQRHVGDLGNLEANESGVAHYETTDPIVMLEGPNAVVGKAVIIHRGADDFTTQPTGAAGARLACGVIESTSE